MRLLAIIDQWIKERERARIAKIMCEQCWRPLWQSYINTMVKRMEAAEAGLKARYEVGDLDPVLLDVLKRHNVFSS